MNEPAFPTAVPFADSGLTKRELFAAMAMQGMMIATGHKPYKDRINQIADEDGVLPFVVIADPSVQAADALIAELAKERTP